MRSKNSSASLVAGYESPSLASLAGAEKDQQPADLRDLFEAALRELGAALPNRRMASEQRKRSLANRVLRGELTPREGARELVSLLHEIESELPKSTSYVGDSFRITRIVGLYYSYDDLEIGDSIGGDAIDYGIRVACERLARGEDANGSS